VCSKISSEKSSWKNLQNQIASMVQAIVKVPSGKSVCIHHHGDVSRLQQNLFELEGSFKSKVSNFKNSKKSTPPNHWPPNHLSGFLVSGIPIDDQLLLLNGRICHDLELASSESPVFLQLRVRSGLLGGKGGFGSLLRGNSGTALARQTSNFDACRDLQGRRMRHVNNAKMLEEWMNKVWLNEFSNCMSLTQ
jgi:hypothetical protein